MTWLPLPERWSFQDPWLLILALLLPCALLWRLRRRPPTRAFGPYAFAHGVPRSLRQRWRGLPTVLQGVAFLCLVLALARPQESRQVPVEEEGIDLLLCLDLSSSMAATDLDPTRPTWTRLAVARDAARTFIEARAQDRIGLVSFARDAQRICPPTADHASLLALLEDLEQVPAGDPQDATGIGVALARCAVYLRDLETPSKVVVLLSDGEETVAADPDSAAIHPQDAAALCRAWGIRVYTVAAGPEAQATRAALTTLAATTGGQAFAAADAEGLHQVYAAIDQLERTRLQRLPWSQVERFLPFLFVGCLLWWGAAALRRSLWEVRA